MGIENVQDLFHKQNYCLPKLLDGLHALFTENRIAQVDCNSTHLFDLEILKEIEAYISTNRISVYLGSTLRDIKCIIEDESGRKHEILVYYTDYKKIHVTQAKMPCSHLIQREYGSLEEILTACVNRINDLSCYFYQLELLDQLCAVMEPTNPTFADDFRRIYLDDRSWLHVEVTADGLGTNIHLIGNTEEWHNKLQSGLLNWDHDKNIVENILSVFELTSFSFPVDKCHNKLADNIPGPTCSICLCVELPGACGLPQPLCKNYACGVFFHRTCLFQWLIACSGNHQPAFGVASGSCPSCFQPIDCHERDS